MTPSPHDALFKAVFSEPENAAGELRSILPARIASAIAWPTLKLEPGSYIDDELRERCSDLLFSAALASGRPALVHVLFEHQSSPDAWMAFRLLRYMLRIWEAFRTREPGATRLPVILPVVLHHGKERSWRAGRLLECVDLDAELEGDLAPFVPDFAFVVDDLDHVDDDQLRARSLTAHVTLTLAVMRDARGATEMADLIRRFAAEAAALLAQPSGVDAFRLLMRYVLQVSNIAVDDLRVAVAALGPRAEETVVTTGDMLVEKGRVQGRVEGRAEAVLALLMARAVPVSPGERDRILACRDPEALDRWLLAAATAPSAHDVLG